MENQEKVMHTCKGCRYYNAVYIKSVYGFDRQQTGFCEKQQKIVNKNENCELYKYRKFKEKVVTLEHLDIVIDEIKELERLFSLLYKE